MGLILLAAVIAVPFCLAGGIASFLITYEGYMRGQSPNRRLAFRAAIQTAIAAVVVFAVITAAIGWALTAIIGQ